MGIYYSSNPTEWTELDGIYVFSTYAPPSIQSQGTNTVAIASVLDWGDNSQPYLITTSKDIVGKFGMFSNLERYLSGLKFSKLAVMRVASSDDKKAKATMFNNMVEVEAAYSGVLGNNITIVTKVDKDNNNLSMHVTMTQCNNLTTSKAVTVFEEVYNDINVGNWSSKLHEINNKSKLIKLSGVIKELPNEGKIRVTLSEGVTGLPSPTEFVNTLGKLDNNPMIGAVSIFLTDNKDYSKDLAQFVKLDNTSNPNKLAIIGDCCNLESAIGNAINYNSTEGRVIYCPVSLNKRDSYGDVLPHPSNFIMASILSSTSADKDPAYVGHSSYFSNVVSLYGDTMLTRGHFIAGVQAGLCLVEYDRSFGFKFVSPVTCGGDKSKGLDSIVTRRMRDLLEDSVSKYLKMYQNADNTEQNRNAVRRSIENFLKSLQDLGMLPITADKSKPVFVVSVAGNTQDVISKDMFIIEIKVRIKSSMRYIVVNSQVNKQAIGG